MNRRWNYAASSRTGAQPSVYTVNGQTIRPLGGESDKGYALLKSLDASQQKQAILSYNLADLVLGPVVLHHDSD